MKSELAFLDILRSIAQEGLGYAKDKYDIARYKRLLELASEGYAGVTNARAEELLTLLKKEKGVVTPRVGVDVAIFNELGKLLVLHRTHDDSWGLPGGWADVGESPFETAIREAFEETGLSITPRGYIAISSKGPTEYENISHQVDLLVAAEPVLAEVKIVLSHEHDDYMWIDKHEDLSWHPGHLGWRDIAFDFQETGEYLPHSLPR